jgi:membrane protein implicated in regulation of membrane protease activity
LDFDLSFDSLELGSSVNVFSVRSMICAMTAAAWLNYLHFPILTIGVTSALVYIFSWATIFFVRKLEQPESLIDLEEYVGQSGQAYNKIESGAMGYSFIKVRGSMREVLTQNIGAVPILQGEPVWVVALDEKASVLQIMKGDK